MTETDPTGSFPMAYDASRKAPVAMLINQGLRPTSRGGHIVIEDALRTQLAPPRNEIVDRFGWMRSVRTARVYPSFDRRSASAEDAAQAQAPTAQIIEKSEQLLDLMPVYSTIPSSGDNQGRLKLLRRTGGGAYCSGTVIPLAKPRQSRCPLTDATRFSPLC